MIVPDNDWRLTGQERFLAGVTLEWRSYQPSRSASDHDHCEFCGAKFMIGSDPDTLHAGYTTLDGYHWVCELCARDFVDRFEWTLRGSPTP